MTSHTPSRVETEPMNGPLLPYNDVTERIFYDTVW